MICPVCQGKPSFPPCMECGGSGFSHCCDGPPEQLLSTTAIGRALDIPTKPEIWDGPGDVEGFMAEAASKGYYMAREFAEAFLSHPEVTAARHGFKPPLRPIVIPPRYAEAAEAMGWLYEVERPLEAPRTPAGDAERLARTAAALRRITTGH